MNNNYSDYIVYVDESGDHSLVSIDPEFPVFVLALTIFKKSDYSDETVPLFKKLKFDYFGHDIVILHENEIRRRKNEFKIFNTKEKYNAFMQALSNAIEESEFEIIAVLIDKKRLSQKYSEASNPYHIALKYAIERLYRYLKERDQENKTTHIVVEKRGAREDDQLELEFRRICDGDNWFNAVLPFQIVMADKKTNSAGLQLSDMIARPIAIHYLNSVKENRAYEIIKRKFYSSKNGEFNGWGLKCFP